MTRQEAKKRRQQLAKAMQNNASIADVAIEFGVSEDLVRRACREFGVKASSRDAKPSKPAKVQERSVLSELRNGKTPEEIATRYDLPTAKVVRMQKRIASGLPSESSKR
jgi:transposase-like protein